MVQGKHKRVCHRFAGNECMHVCVCAYTSPHTHTHTPHTHRLPPSAPLIPSVRQHTGMLHWHCGPVAVSSSMARCLLLYSLSLSLSLSLSFCMSLTRSLTYMFYLTYRYHFPFSVLFSGKRNRLTESLSLSLAHAALLPRLLALALHVCVCLIYSWIHSSSRCFLREKSNENNGERLCTWLIPVRSYHPSSWLSFLSQSIAPPAVHFAWLWADGAASSSWREHN